jgi:acetyl esterase/lipase
LLSEQIMFAVLRLIGGLFFLGLASLTLIQPPNRILWAASVAATEWGYWIALATVVVLIPTRSYPLIGRLGGLMALGAIALFVMPVVKAKQLNATLPTSLDASFGKPERERHDFAQPPRPEPLNLTELLNPVDLPAIRYEERVFAAYDGQDLTLSIYRPAYVHDAVPVILMIHGGTWRDGDRHEFAQFNAYFASRDYVVVAMDYRLAPKYPFPAARDDVLSAVAYLKVYAKELNIDPTRIALFGRSGGGQLALLSAYTAQEPAIRGVVSLYGPSDLRFEYEHPGPAKVSDTRAAIEAYLGGAPSSTTDDAYYAASPVNFVSATSPPSLLVQGERDPIVSVDHAARLEARLQKAGVKHLVVRLPWATHGCDKSFGGPCGQIVSYAVERFLDSVMIVPHPAKPKPSRTRSAALHAKSARKTD